MSNIQMDKEEARKHRARQVILCTKAVHRRVYMTQTIYLE